MLARIPNSIHRRCQMSRVRPEATKLEAAVLQPPANNVAGITLLDIFGDGLGESIPADDRMELRLFLAFDRAVGGQAEAGDGFPILGVSKLGVAGSVVDQDDFVDPSHPPIIATV